MTQSASPTAVQPLGHHSQEPPYLHAGQLPTIKQRNLFQLLIKKARTVLLQVRSKLMLYVFA
jgi:hypothetical protein